MVGILFSCLLDLGYSSILNDALCSFLAALCLKCREGLSVKLEFEPIILDLHSLKLSVWTDTFVLV